MRKDYSFPPEDCEAHGEGYRLGCDAIARRIKNKQIVVGAMPSAKTFEKWRGQHEAFLAGWMRAMKEWGEKAK